MLRAKVLACSHYMAALDGGDVLPALDERLRSACRKPYRRIDRFVQLALAGSARCVEGVGLSGYCGLYIGSTHGPLTSNIRVQQQMLRDHDLPKPFNFVNTLGSIAGFYVADNLRLNGPSWFVSRHRRSLEAVLEAALTDIATGAVDQALVGVVEEAPLALADQRQRLPVAADTVLAEGSHWMLLAPCAPGNRQRAIGLRRFADDEALQSCLPLHKAASISIGLSRTLAPASAQWVRRQLPQAVDIAGTTGPFHDSLEAAWFVEQAENAADDDVLLVNGAGADGCVLYCGNI